MNSVHESTSTRQRQTRKALIITIAAIFTLSIGFMAGRFSASSIDLLCYGSYKPYRLTADFADSEGRNIPAGTTISFRSCEYASAARFEFLIDKEDARRMVPADDDRSKGVASYMLWPREEY